MGGYKNCRSAKTAEEYLLKCLFAAEEERDKAVFYAESLKIAKTKELKKKKKEIEGLRKNLKKHQFFKLKKRKLFLLK